MDNMSFQERIAREAELRNRALSLLGLSESASSEDIRRAWRQECMRTHPDRNPGDPEARKKFNMVNCAYRFLVDRTPCRELEKYPDNSGSPANDADDLPDNQWGAFLWWREKFF